MIEGVGRGFIVTDNELVCVQPVAVIVSKTCIVPVPAAPQVTVIELVPAPAVTVPPVTVQA